MVQAQKLIDGKMLSSLTTVDYIVLVLQYIRLWGVEGKLWLREVRS